MFQVSGTAKIAGMMFALLLAASPAFAQLEVGDNLSMRLNGTVAGGYTGTYGDTALSSHSISGSGTATLAGSYYNPNFLSFSASPYYGQSRANSNFQSIFDSSGIASSASIFAGSHFPGSVSYTKAYNSEGTLGVPGGSNYTTRGQNDSFGVSWAENLPDEPSLTASFQRTGSDYSLLGTDRRGNSTAHSFALHTGYSVAGFGLGAFFQDGSSHSSTPGILAGEQGVQDHTSDNMGYGFNASHALPFRGSAATAFTHSEFSTGFADGKFDGSINLVTTNAGIQPTNRLHISSAFSYSDNLSGQIFEQVVAAGGTTPTLGLNQKSSNMDEIVSVTYAVSHNVQAEADVDHRSQSFLGKSFGAQMYSGSVTYTSGLLGGNVNAAVSVRDSRIDGSNQNTMGFSTSLNYNRRWDGWVFGGSFSYSQNVQTILITYMNSYYMYSGNIRRRWGQFNWSAGAGASRTALTSQNGQDNRNQSYSTGVGYSRYLTLTGSYSKNSGSGLLTATGVAQNPLLPPVVPGLVWYAGDSYAASISSNPAKKLTLAFAYTWSNSNTGTGTDKSSDMNRQMYGIFQYQVRKLYVNGGYSWMKQGFSASGVPPATVSSFYFGISRWFNFF